MRSNGPSLRSGIVPSALIILVMSALVALVADRPAQAQQFENALQWLSVGPSGSQIGSGKINAFAFVQSNPNVMYMGGGWGNTPRESPSQSGIYRTTDRGRHWTSVNKGLTNTDGTISSATLTEPNRRSSQNRARRCMSRRGAAFSLRPTQAPPGLSRFRPQAELRRSCPPAARRMPD
jgi:hypothetical protein